MHIRMQAGGTPQLKFAQGPVNLTAMKGYSTTFAISAFTKIEAK